MSKDELEKLFNQTINNRELATLLLRLGFQKKSGRGSHIKWVKQGLPPLIIATHSKEVKPYQLKQVIRILRIGGLI